MTTSTTGSLQSPGYPGNYPNYTRCIWILEAPEQHVTQLTVNFVGETYNSACSDYVEVKTGSVLVLDEMTPLPLEKLECTFHCVFYKFALHFPNEAPPRWLSG